MSEADALDRLCSEQGIEVPPGWHDYFRMAKQWGARTDLTSARTDLELAEILFVDAIQLVVAEWHLSGSSLLDVGAGVGAPSVPILAARPALMGSLVEPRRIRTAFLRTVVGSLGLAARTTVLEARVDPASPSVRGAPFDLALSRATFAPEEWRRIGVELAHEVWVLTAGANLDDDPDLETVRRLDYVVPSSGAPRAAIAYRRRRAGMI